MDEGRVHSSLSLSPKHHLDFCILAPGSDPDFTDVLPSEPPVHQAVENSLQERKGQCPCGGCTIAVPAAGSLSPSVSAVIPKQFL